ISHSAFGKKCSLTLLLARKRLLSAVNPLEPSHAVNTMNLSRTLVGMRSELATVINNATFQHIFERQGSYVRQLLKEEVLDVQEIKTIEKEDLFGRLIETVVQDINAREVYDEHQNPPDAEQVSNLNFPALVDLMPEMVYVKSNQGQDYEFLIEHLP